MDLTPRHDAVDDAPVCHPDPIEGERSHQAAFRDRQVRGLVRLLSEREDLRGCHRLADLVDDAVRWSA